MRTKSGALVTVVGLFLAGCAVGAQVDAPQASQTPFSVLPAGMVSIPDVLDQEQDAAVASLVAAGLVAVPMMVQGPDPASLGRVVAQDPFAGVVVAVGTEVRIHISSGPTMQVIPTGLVGQPYGVVEAKLAALGFTEVISVAEPADAKAGEVTRLSPDEGTTVAPDTPIKVFYAQ